jgi:Cu(I)/Ag(I) efflux system membrane fusion protein
MRTIVHVAVAVMLLFGATASIGVTERVAAVDSSVPVERSYTGHRAKGIVEKVDAAARRLTVKHGPVPSLGWSARTTTFDVLDRISLDGIKAGNEVDFEFIPNDKGGYLITLLSKSTTLDGRAQLDGAGARSSR